MSLTTRKMSDRHEQDLVAVLGGEKTRNSGAVWSDQADGHQTGLEQHYRFAWDGKSTLGESIGVSLKMLAKLREQSRGLIPMLPLRWYLDTRLTMVSEDWGAVPLDVLSDLIEDANQYRLILEVGCHQGTHRFALQESGSVPGMRTPTGPCIACGSSTYDAGYPHKDED